jgi:hypothetical protein
MKLSEHPEWEQEKLNVVRDIIDDLEIPYIVMYDNRYKEFIFRSTNEFDFIVNIPESIIGKDTEDTLEDTIDNKMQDTYKNFKFKD